MYSYWHRRYRRSLQVPSRLIYSENLLAYFTQFWLPDFRWSKPHIYTGNIAGILFPVTDPSFKFSTINTNWRTMQSVHSELKNHSTLPHRKLLPRPDTLRGFNPRTGNINNNSHVNFYLVPSTTEFRGETRDLWRTAIMRQLHKISLYLHRIQPVVQQ